MTRLFVMMIALISFAGVGCRSPFDVAWRGTHGAMGMTQTAGDGLGKIERPKHEACLSKYGAKTVGYVICIQKTKKRIGTWQRYLRAVARSSIAGTVGGIRVAEEAKKDKIDWLATLKPAGCALLRGLREWGDELPDKGKSLLTALSWLDPVLCVAPKKALGADGSAVTIAATVIDIGIIIARWVVKILGDPVGEIKKELHKWLTDPPKDATDSLMTDIKAALPAGK